MGEGDQTADLLWGADRTARRDRPKLSLERILDVAIELADAEGLATLSMQRIADRLGYTKMSLYRYTPGRAELIALMLDTAIGSPPNLADGVWRPRLRQWAYRLGQRFRRHPWAMEAATGGRVMGPNELGWMEAGLSCLADSGLTGAERLDVIVLVTGHVRTLAQQAVASESPERDLSSVMAEVIRRRADEYPEAAAAFADAREQQTQDDALDFGLDRIFDGLEALIDQRSAD